MNLIKRGLKSEIFMLTKFRLKIVLKYKKHKNIKPVRVGGTLKGFYSITMKKNTLSCQTA